MARRDPDDGAPKGAALTARERAILAERLRARDAGVVKAALETIGRRKDKEMAGAVAALLTKEQAERRAAVVIEALKTLGDLGAAEELARAEERLPASYGGWVTVARKRMPTAQ